MSRSKQDLIQYFYQMINFKNILIALVAVCCLMAPGCQRNSATMQELSRLDTMVYHQREKEALPLLQQMDTERMSKQEQAYHAVLLSMALYLMNEDIVSAPSVLVRW